MDHLDKPLDHSSQIIRCSNRQHPSVDRLYAPSYSGAPWKKFLNLAFKAKIFVMQKEEGWGTGAPEPLKKKVTGSTQGLNPVAPFTLGRIQ